MRLARTANAYRGIVYGLLEKIVTLFIPFICRTIFIKVLDTEYLGLNSLFASILTILNLTELGFGTAIVYSMYQPIADNDTSKINALLYYYKTVYSCVGGIILAVGLTLIPILPRLISGSYPNEINITAVYLVFLGDTAISYFLFAYKGALINAFQRNDLNSKINIAVSTVLNCTQMIVLVVFRNYYCYILLMPVCTILKNILTYIITQKHFSQYKESGTLSQEDKKSIRRKVGGLMISRLCGVSRNSFDSIFLSAFMGLAITALYNNYFFILNTVTGFILLIYNSILAGVGNSVATESVEKNYRDMCKVNFIYMWLSGWATVCLVCLYQPFIKIWLGEEFLLPMGCMLLFCAYFYMLKIGDIRSVYVDAVGIWWESRYKTLIEAVLNILLNYYLGKYFGIYGIITATILTLFFVNFVYGTHLVFKYYFKEQSIKEYFESHFLYAFCTFFIGILTMVVCAKLPDTIVFFVIKMLICVVLPNLCFWLIYRNLPIYHQTTKWAAERIPRKYIEIFRKIIKR